jgi:hypothetical protein
MTERAPSAAYGAIPKKEMVGPSASTLGAPVMTILEYLLLMTLIAIEMAFAGWIAWLLV